jgi:hypothetical protein
MVKARFPAPAGGWTRYPAPLPQIARLAIDAAFQAAVDIVEAGREGPKARLTAPSSLEDEPVPVRF